MIPGIKTHNLDYNRQPTKPSCREPIGYTAI